MHIVVVVVDVVTPPEDILAILVGWTHSAAAGVADTFVAVVVAAVAVAVVPGIHWDVVVATMVLRT